MIKEQQDMIVHIGRITMSIVQPFSQLLGAVSRVVYLQNQIEMVTPKPKLVEKEDDKMVLKEEGVKGAEATETAAIGQG